MKTADEVLKTAADRVYTERRDAFQLGLIAGFKQAGATDEEASDLAKRTMYDIENPPAAPKGK
jgi:hypothetical protein